MYNKVQISVGPAEWFWYNNLGEAIGVIVKLSKVRLKFGEEQAQYAWKFINKSLVPLFDKHLSKYLVGAYKQLHWEAGKGFYAVDLKDISKVIYYLPKLCTDILWADTDWTRTLLNRIL
jgi:hypothetical protein